MIATLQDDGSYLVPSPLGRFATREAAEQAHYEHVDRIRQALGREPTHRELLHGPTRHDPRDQLTKQDDANWQPVVDASDTPSKTGAQYRNYYDRAETPGDIRRGVDAYRKETLALAEAGELRLPDVFGGEPKAETPDLERQATIRFVERLESEAFYDPSLDHRHIESLRKLRLQAERGSLIHFRDMAKSWTAERDKADEARLAEFDQQIAALKTAHSKRARLNPMGLPYSEEEITAQPDPDQRGRMRYANMKARETSNE